ncbi:hypothetical protein ACIP5T_17255 [Microbacterium sp. NPDC088619]|uniref:hypothetical protein n=1 Tax=Microbacterium sp. NPDC088619 TaxID=3364196 RepID=UPI00382FD41A
MFTRLFTEPDGDTTVIDYLTPTLVKGPYFASRSTRTIVHELLQSDVTRVTHLPVRGRAGTFVAVFTTSAAASAALEWFTGPYLYLFTKAGATAAQTLFAVSGGELSIRENADSSWDVEIPYREVIE